MKMIIPVLIPISPDRIIPEEVLSSILNQGVPVTIYASNAIGTGAAKARGYLKGLLRDDPGYVMTTDNDIVLPDRSLIAMIDSMERNTDFAGVAISKHYSPENEIDEPRHVDAGPVLWRSEAYNKVEYHISDGCECLTMCNDLRHMGYRIGFLGGFQCHHIIDTRKNNGK